MANFHRPKPLLLIFYSSCQAGGIRRRVGTGIRRRGQGTSGGSRKGGMPGIVTKRYSYVLIFETDFDIAPLMGPPPKKIQKEQKEPISLVTKPVAF